MILTTSLREMVQVYILITIMILVNTKHIISELSPTLVGEAFYNGEVENELRRINRIDYLFKKDCDRDHCMRMIDIVRQCNNYPHLPSDCTDDCGKRGTCVYNTTSLIKSRNRMAMSLCRLR